MSEFEQADVLRAAGEIKALLDDGRLHRWGYCIELARDFTGGRWREASDLAWEALTVYIDRPCVWSGDKGARLIAFAQPTKAVELVPCPACGAAAGEVCVILSSRGKKPKRYPHRERECVAAALPAQRTERHQHKTRGRSSQSKV